MRNGRIATACGRTILPRSPAYRLPPTAYCYPPPAVPPKPILAPKLTAALTDAVRSIEARSCAEVVVEIRSRSGSYAHAYARFAALIAFIALLFLLFSPWAFAAYWVAIDVAAVYAAGLFVARRSDSIRRLMTRAEERQAQVRTLAAALFHDRGIANTSGETGVFVYLSLLERRLEILADRGVLLAVPAMPWNQLLEQAAACGTAEALVELMRGMAPLLSEYLPARENDVDELANEPRLLHE
jgi:putative membrane protein